MLFKIVSLTLIFLFSSLVAQSQIRVEKEFLSLNYNTDSSLVLLNTDKKAEEDNFFNRKWSADIFLYPQFRFKNSRLDRMYLVQANINPTLHFNMWKGASVTAQLIVPIYNDYSFDESKVRPGFLTFNQRFLLPGNFRFLATVGNFNMQRAGIDLKVFKNITNNLGVHGQIGVTGWSLPYINNWYFSDLNQINWRVGVNYFIKSKNILLNLNVSKHLENDIAARGEVIRYFRNASIGFYVQTLRYDDYSFNGGFFFTIALPPRNKGNKRIRVSTADCFSLEYIARPYPKRGKMYMTAPDENSSFNFFNNFLLNLH